MECGHLRRDLLVSVAIVFGNFFCLRSGRAFLEALENAV